MDEESLVSWVVASFSPRNGGQLTARAHSDPRRAPETPKFRWGPPIIVALTLVYFLEGN